MRNKILLLITILNLSTFQLFSQVTLPSGTNYSQNFDGIGSGLPTGWTVRTGANSSSRGTTASFTTTTTTWATTSGNFRNCASTSGLNSTSSNTDQNNSTNRAVAIRQTGSFGDPGAAFELEIANTLGKTDFELDLNHLLLNSQGRSTTWSVQYSKDTGSTWSTLGTFTDPGAWGSTSSTYNFGSNIDNVKGIVLIRIAALNSATGSGSRDTYGIDDFELSWTNCSPTDVLSSNTADSNTFIFVNWADASCYQEIYIFVDETSGLQASPSGDGSSYTANNSYSTAGQCVYKGIGNSVYVTGLTNGTTYSVEIYTRNGTTWSSGVELTPTPNVKGLNISSLSTTYTIDFDSTLDGVNNGQFDGSGFSPNPSSGQINSEAFSISLASNNNLFFGGDTSGSSNNYARGNSNAGVGTGGIYAFNVGTGDRALGMQPTSSVFTSGNIVLKINNSTGSAVSRILVEYDIYVYNDQDRSNILNFDHSSNNQSFSSLSSMNLTSDEAAASSPSWKKYSRKVLLTPFGGSLANTGIYYLRWSGDDDGGSGNRDEFAIDNIKVTMYSTAPSSLPNDITETNLKSLAISAIDATLDNDLTVDSLLLRNAVLTIGNHRLTINGVHTINTTSTAFINTNGSGVVRRNFNQTGSFIYPIGRGNDYTPITLDFTTGSFSNAYVDVRVVNSKHPNNTSTTDYIERYWEINQSGLTSFNCNVVANYTKSDVQGTEGNLYAGLYSSSTWSLGLAVSTSDSSLTYPNATSFSDISGGEQAVLPVSWYSFEGISEDLGNRLFWATSMEYNAQDFEVEYSRAGGEFKSIGIIPAVGFSNSIQYYEFFHPNRDKNALYRLKQNDFDGKYEYSEVIRIDRLGVELNPVLIKTTAETFEISWYLSHSEGNIELYDAMGRKLMEVPVSEMIVIQRNNLPKGMIIGRISNSNVTVIKLMNY